MSSHNYSTQSTPFIWKNGKLIPWEQATTHVLTHTLHYSGGAFEGIRCYKTPKGPAVFRLKDHVARLFYSARALKMKLPFSQKEIERAILETLRKNKLQEAYIRPLVYFGYGVMGLNPKGAPIEVVIVAWQWGKYLAHDAVKVKISSFMRIHPQSTIVDAKLCGHYLNSILAVRELEGTPYHEALFLDHKGDVAEGPGENLFLIKGKTIFTPKLGSILPGLTRDTVMKLAQDKKYSVKEVTIKPRDLFSAGEAFFTGTAAEITPIGSIDDHVFGKGEPGPITTELQAAYHQLVHGESSKHDHFLSYL